MTFIPLLMDVFFIFNSCSKLYSFYNFLITEILKTKLYNFSTFGYNYIKFNIEYLERRILWQKILKRRIIKIKETIQVKKKKTANRL